MIGRITQRNAEVKEEPQTGFDSFELRLGDIMRGERATLGKSLLDVQRELRIKAAYIAAIENCDPSAFDTPGFIAGYVRSYARYLGMDPDDTFAVFCQESGFSTAHGMSERASSPKPAVMAGSVSTGTRDPFTEPAMPFAPSRDSLWSQVEPGAIGSVLVLVALIGGVGYGGYSVLQEIQQVQIAPVDQTPIVLSDLDPLNVFDAGDAAVASAAGVFEPPSGEGFDRLYRPEALDVPVLIARDAPISTLDPTSVGAFARLADQEMPQVETESFAFVAADEASAVDPIEAALAEVLGGSRLPQVLEPLGPGVLVVAARQSWVRVRDASGATIYEAIMQPGDSYEVPQL
ncbi:MAG: DUF4115 domain-containing protein, partial [Rhodobacteraceae bacterium]|nr:DUF4115 domain-containing protein [Paracoccaceae bacterium]